jgi:hypothetical protein
MAVVETDGHTDDAGIAARLTPRARSGALRAVPPVPTHPSHFRTGEPTLLLGGDLADERHPRAASGCAIVVPCGVPEVGLGV